MKKKMLGKLVALLIICIMAVSMVAACGNGDAGGSGSPAAGGSSSPAAGESGSPAAGGNSSPAAGGSSSPAAGGDSSGSGGGKDTLTIAITADRGTLDPSYARGADAANSLAMIYEYLWGYNSAGERYWILATDLEIVEPTLWRVKLREGVTFSNGNVFNAEDVLFSLWRATSREGHPNDIQYLDYDNCKVINDYEIEIAFTRYDIAYPYGLAAPIFDKESYDEDSLPTTPIGTGPYKLDEYVVNSHIRLVARDDYWGEAPGIKYLMFQMLAEASQRINALQTGMVDICGVPFQDIEFVKSIPGYNVDIFSTSNTVGLYLNIARTSVFYDNIDKKMAFAMAVDREAMVDIAYSGYASVSRYPASMANTDIDERMLDYGIYGIGYDPERARELAISSGLVNDEVLLINSGSDTNVVMCELIQENLREIGVTVNVRNLDQGSWLATIFDDTQYDALLDAVQSSFFSAANAIRAWTSMANGGNKQEDPYPNNKRFLEIWEMIMSVSDPDEFRELSVEFSHLHTDALLWLALVDEQRAIAYSASLSGYEKTRVQAIMYNRLYW